MADQTITTHHHQEFYTSTKTISSYMSKESRSNFSSSLFNADTTTTTVDACLDNNNRKNLLHVNSTGTNNKLFESKTFSNERQCVKVEDKSFIEQRIERLYGPGALAHGFLVMKKHHHQQQQQHNRSFVVDKAERHVDNHSKSMLENMIENDTSTENDDDQMKQSNSFPSLPVLRHLRPEFRAQLPIIGSKKSAEVLTKSHTVPIMKEEAKTNGHSSETNDVKQLNGNETEVACEKIELETEKDGHRFIRILENEAKRLLALADVAEKELEDPHLPEEAKGFLRSASGKAKLLVSQKMQQFKGLCTKNITQVDGEAFPTTGEDLQGFWDMVMLQVDQIDALFKELKVLKANNWQEKAEDEVDKPKISRNGATNNRTKKVLKSKPSAEAEEARKQRELQRKQMIETRRKAMREQKQNEAASQQQNIEIFVPETSS